MTKPESDFNPYAPPEFSIGGFIVVAPNRPAWLTIFVRPRATIRRLLDSNRKAAVLPLAMNLGLANSLLRAHERHQAAGKSAGRFFVEVFGGGVISGIFIVFFLGFLIWLTGRWVGGRATQGGLRTAIAWASMPYVPLVIFQMMALPIYGLAPYRKEPPFPGSRQEAVFVLIVAIGNVIASGWSIFLWVKCVAEAHRFNWVKSLTAWFLGYLTAVGVGLMVVGVAYMLGFPLVK